MAQLREGISNVFQHKRYTVPVLYVGAVDDGMDQKAVFVGDEMAFPAFL
jgi:hypothetical protein